MTKHYSGQGVLLGNLWGGGKGLYPTIKIGEMSFKALERQARKYLEDGSLDSGMGFESLIGALIPVTVTETITRDGKEYTRKDFHSYLIVGDLTEEELSFLEEAEGGL